MPGYFTQSRVSNEPATVKATDRFNMAHPTTGIAIDVGRQLTTSFRSRDQTDDEIIADADKIFINGFRSNFGGHIVHGSKNPYIDTGHAFRTVRQSYKLSHPYGFVANSNDNPTFQSSYEGALVPYDAFNGGGTYPSVDPLTDSEVAYYGHVAIAQTNPVKPDAGISDFLSQSILTKMPKFVGDISQIYNRATAFKNLGDQYLNLQFGWIPFVSDLKALLNTVLNSYKETKTFEKGSGKITRRHFTFAPIVETLLSQDSSGGTIQTPTSLPEIWGNRTYGAINRTLTRRQDIYFKGAYTYYLPWTQKVNKLAEYADLAQKLLGLKLTPQVLWDLAPWTWLADWKLDITSMLEIQSDLGTDSLVLLYGYLMRTTTVENTYTLTGLDPNVGTRGPYRVAYSVVQKERVQATPYGFGVNPEDFSLRQLAVLAALGITRTVIR